MLQSTAGSLQSLCWASSAVGGIASAYFSGALVEAYGPRAVFGLTAVFPLLVSVSAVFISEQPIVNARHKRSEADADNAELGTSRPLYGILHVICMNDVLVHFHMQPAPPTSSQLYWEIFMQQVAFERHTCSKCVQTTYMRQV